MFRKRKRVSCSCCAMVVSRRSSRKPGPVQLGGTLFQMLSMGRVLLPPGGVGDRAPVA